MSRTYRSVLPRALGVAAAAVALSSSSVVAPAARADIPGTSLNPTAWLRADAVNGVDASGNPLALPANGAAVGTWADSSGNGRNASQALTLQRPTFATSTINGQPVVRFDGSSVAGEGDFLNVGGGAWAASSAGKLTLFVVAKDNRSGGDTNNRAVISTRSGSTGWLTSYEPNATTQKYVHIGSFNGGNASNTTLSDSLGANAFHLLELRRDGLVIEEGHDGTWLAPVNFIGQNTSALNVTQIGNNDGNTSRFFKGDIAEIIAFDGAVLNNTDRNDVEQYLIQKYAIGAVPEPTGLGVLGATMTAALLGRRRRASGR